MLSLPPLRIDDQGRFRDRRGREIVLRGLNTGGRSKAAPYLPFEIEPGADLEEVAHRARAYFSRMVGWGLNCARLLFSWEGVEPEPGRLDEVYLQRLEVMLGVAHELGLWVVVDFHQDLYASTFGGDGFPPWTLPGGRGAQEPPPPPERFWFLRYLVNDDVQRAFDQLWSGPGPVRQGLVEMWRQVASRLGGHPAVVGFEPMNEPGWGSWTDLASWRRECWLPLFEEISDAIRAEAPSTPLFFDPTGLEAAVPLSAEDDEAFPCLPAGQLAFAPHLYDPGLLMGWPWLGQAPEASLRRFDRLRAQHGVAVLLGEFGYTHGAPGGEPWLRRVMEELDRLRLSATLWEYSDSSWHWNHEDLGVTGDDGAERPILDVYVRPWLRALAGHDPQLWWDPKDRICEARWVADGGTTELVAPARIFGPDGPARVQTWGKGAHARLVDGLVEVSGEEGEELWVVIEG